MKKEYEAPCFLESQITTIGNGFFKNLENVEKYDLGSPYDTNVYSLKEGVIARGFRVSRDIETCRKEFDCFLQNCGYIPKNDGEIIGKVGSIFKGKFLPGWLKYSKEGKKDLWVSQNGFDFEGWQDIFITTRPDQITIGDTSISIAFSQAVEKQAQMDSLYQRFDLS